MTTVQRGANVLTYCNALTSELVSLAMAIPPLYKCQICDIEIDPKSPNSVRQAVVWLKGTSRTVAHIITEDYRYQHTFCMSKENYDQLLFEDF